MITNIALLRFAILSPNFVTNFIIEADLHCNSKSECVSRSKTSISNDLLNIIN